MEIILKAKVTPEFCGQKRRRDWMSKNQRLWTQHLKILVLYLAVIEMDKIDSEVKWDENEIAFCVYP